MRGLIGWILVSFATGAVGVLATRHARELYAGLVKPTWAPPSWFFFAWRRGALAFADIVLLLGLIVATLLAFARVDRLAAVLLLPYLAWVVFATTLTHAIWRANLDQLSRSGES